MGDIADLMIEQMIENGSWGRPHTPRRPRCRHCGTRRVDWKWTDARWRLHDRDGVLHACNRSVASADEFTTITP